MDLRGVYPALVSPFRKDASFDFDVLRALVRKLAEAGVRGFYIGGSSSELFSLTMEERKKVMEAARDAAPDSCSVIAHIGAMNPADAADLARHAGAVGCDAISAIPPFYGSYSWTETATYYRSLIDASGLRLFLYNIPSFTGVSLKVEQYKEIAAQGGIAGVKHTDINLYDLERLKAADPDAVVLAGMDQVFCAALAMGADGCIGTSVNTFPEYYLRIYAYMKANNLPAARQTQSVLNELLEVFLGIGFFPATKHLLRYRGIDAGLCRAPILPITREQEQSLEQAFERCEKKMAAINASHPLSE